MNDTGDYQVLEQLLEAKDGKRRLVWYWYRVAGRTVTNKYEAKILQLLALLTGERMACVTAVATEFDEQPEIARNRLFEYVFEAGPIEIGVFDWF